VPIHQDRPGRRPDDAFLPGCLELLVPGNRCRALDDRRTPGVIDAVDPDTAMFRWRITAFEDAGKCWEMPLEEVSRFQFETSSRRLEPEQKEVLAARTERFRESLEIPAREEDRHAAETEIRAVEAETREWLPRRSRTFLSCTFDLRVARRGFSDFDRESRFRQSLLMKATVPVSRLFMTCLETASMNRRYGEAEALLLGGPVDPFLPPAPVGAP
jgi:hypothetical protein